MWNHLFDRMMNSDKSNSADFKILFQTIGSTGIEFQELEYSVSPWFIAVNTRNLPFLQVLAKFVWNYGNVFLPLEHPPRLERPQNSTPLTYEQDNFIIKLE